GPEHLAYIMYTSGSTGPPNGVCVPHRAILRLVVDASYVTLDSNEVVLTAAPISFDASTFEIWGALLNGARLEIMPPGQYLPAELCSVARSSGTTTLWLTAPLFHLIADDLVGDLTSARQILAGGDVISPASVRKALAALPGVRVINGYGPTENT